jgi:hypothetical protein
MDKDTKVRAVMAMATDALGSSAALVFAGVMFAERRYHPTAPGGCAVRLMFEDGTVLWLVAEED